MRAFGFGEAAIEAARADLTPKAVDQVLRIAGSNVTSVKMLLAMSTQWNAVALSGLSRGVMIRTGLKYETLTVVQQMTGLALTREDFGRLRLLEAECIGAWDEERRAAQ